MEAQIGFLIIFVQVDRPMDSPRIFGHRSKLELIAENAVGERLSLMAPDEPAIVYPSDAQTIFADLENEFDENDSLLVNVNLMPGQTAQILINRGCLRPDISLLFVVKDLPYDGIEDFSLGRSYDWLDSVKEKLFRLRTSGFHRGHTHFFGSSHF